MALISIAFFVIALFIFWAKNAEAISNITELKTLKIAVTVVYLIFRNTTTQFCPD
jgi:hypothetical protein